MKNFILGIGVAAIIGGLVTGVFYLKSQTNKTKTSESSVATPPVPSSAPPTEQIVGNDLDKYGCKYSAGFQWCEAKKKCLRSWEEKCTAEDETEAIREALYVKNGWSRDKIQLVVKLSYNDGKYAKGSVGEVGAAGGGYVFAAKVNGAWEVVADGNGVVLCSYLTKYPDYPKTLISTCYDEVVDKLITR